MNKLNRIQRGRVLTTQGQGKSVCTACGVCDEDDWV